MLKKFNPNIATWLVFIAVIFADQASKSWAQNRQIDSLNFGGVFGIFPGFWWQGVIIIILVYVLIETVKSKNWPEKLGLSLIAAAGLSNLIDRLQFNGVRDFIYWPGLNIRGNLADAVLVIGVIIALVSYQRNEKH